MLAASAGRSLTHAVLAAPQVIQERSDRGLGIYRQPSSSPRLTQARNAPAVRAVLNAMPRAREASGAPSLGGAAFMVYSRWMKAGRRQTRR